jgi:hypothetical protein
MTVSDEITPARPGRRAYGRVNVSSALADETRTLPPSPIASGRCRGQGGAAGGPAPAIFPFNATRRCIDWLPYSDEDLRREVVNTHCRLI